MVLVLCIVCYCMLCYFMLFRFVFVLGDVYVILCLCCNDAIRMITILVLEKTHELLVIFGEQIS